jgi:hypothetical protein
MPKVESPQSVVVLWALIALPSSVESIPVSNPNLPWLSKFHSKKNVTVSKKLSLKNLRFKPQRLNLELN